MLQLNNVEKAPPNLNSHALLECSRTKLDCKAESCLFLKALPTQTRSFSVSNKTWVSLWRIHSWDVCHVLIILRGYHVLIFTACCLIRKIKNEIKQ